MIKIIRKNSLSAGLLALPMLLCSCTLFDDGSAERVDTRYTGADSYYQNNDANYSTSGGGSASASAAESKPKSSVEPSNKPAVPLAAPVAAKPAAQ